MKNFKHILVSIALLSIGAMSAKQVKKATTTTPYQPSPTQPSSTQPIVNKPSSFAKASADKQPTQPAKVKTFEQLYYDVKNAKDAWDSEYQLLNQTFVNNLVQDAIDANINEKQLKFLLNIASHHHAQFTGPKSDMDILNGLADQFIEAVTLFDTNKKTNQF